MLFLAQTLVENKSLKNCTDAEKKDLNLFNFFLNCISDFSQYEYDDRGVKKIF